MAVDASGSNAGSRAGAVYGTIVVVGGGCYGSYYVRQLQRANLAGAIEWERLLVVDRNPHCLVASGPDLDQSELVSPRPEIVIAEWTEFFGDYLGEWQSRTESHPSDSIVPSPLIPHLLYEWVRDRAKSRWPERDIATKALTKKPETPWETASPDGTHYVSFATWTCPINCIEPRICPHTRSERTWTMPTAMQQYVSSIVENEVPFEGPLVFHCTHRAYGVGMIPVSAVVEADRFVEKVGMQRAADFLVATVSHCHGAMSVLSIR